MTGFVLTWIGNSVAIWLTAYLLRSVSVNSWLVRTLAAAVESTGRRSAPPRRSSGGQRITGWAR